MAVLKHVFRVLRVDGVYMVISHSEPMFRTRYFKGFSWDVTIEKIGMCVWHGGEGLTGMQSGHGWRRKRR